MSRQKRLTSASTMPSDDGKWVPRDQLEEEVRQACINGGVAAFQTLQAENQAHAEETDEIIISDLSELGMMILTGFLAKAPTEDQAIMTVSRLAGEWMKKYPPKTSIEKQMLYRQTTMAAGFFVGKPEDGIEIALADEKALLDLP